MEWKIIGRTTVKNSKSHITDDEYKGLRDFAWRFWLDNKINTLPVNLNSIVKNNGWSARAYSKIEDAELKEASKKLLGFTVFVEKTNKYIIFYDSEQPISLQRFTVAHEIAHIVLQHFNKDFVYDEEAQEQQANMFAARLLMPMCLLKECNVTSPEEIETLCHVGSAAAKFRFNRLQELKDRGKYYLNPDEKKVVDGCAEFIKDYLKSKT